MQLGVIAAEAALLVLLAVAALRPVLGLTVAEMPAGATCMAVAIGIQIAGALGRGIRVLLALLAVGM